MLYEICKVKKTWSIVFRFVQSLVVLSMLFTLNACNETNESAQGNWITGTEQEKLEHIENQFRGFDNAMVETAYRYQELYWAGQDENWEYAEYQLEKIKIAIENGLLRRPKRAASAEHFLKHDLPEMQKSVISKDTVIFNQGFQLFTNQCNNCHLKENVLFFTVKTPKTRQSPIQKD